MWLLYDKYGLIIFIQHLLYATNRLHVKPHLSRPGVKDDTVYGLFQSAVSMTNWSFATHRASKSSFTDMVWLELKHE